MIGADTSFLIDFFQGDEEAVEFMEENRDVIHLSENVVYEFLCGDLTDEEVEKFLGFVSHFPVVSFDRDASMRASKIFRKQRKEGNKTAHPDTMIAGSYLGHEIDKIVTRNTEDFQKIEELEVLEY